MQRPTVSGSIRVVIATDIRLYREGLADILARRPSIAVVATAASRVETLAAFTRERPDVLLLDMAMPESIETIRALWGSDDEVKVLAIGVKEREDDVIACAEAGAVGYVLRDATLDDLVASLNSVAQGEALCSPRVAAKLLRRVGALAASYESGSQASQLTTRELEILELVDRGFSNKEIAKEVFIEVATVKNHVHNILQKLRVHRRAEAAARLRSGTSRRRHRRSSDPDPRPNPN